ncbi:MAG: maltose alpha-D-glucosyltransferase [bacterium]
MFGKKRTPLGLEDDPLWYKDAIVYELHVKAFCDSDGDGIGDFNGLRQKLDYLQDLGVTAIWLLPFYPSPFRDDGYDVSDYTGIHPSYGTMQDFKGFLREAHLRGLRVITEVILNHTSDQHPWFQRARRAQPGSSWRDFYVWSDTVDRYRQARIIFEDFESSNWAWDPLAKAYYWHRFYSHQPDLNYDNPQVRKAVFQVLDFWLGMGVDGVRLDAVPYLYERPGTNCENLPETYAFLKELRAHVDSRFRNKMLLAEANQWPEDATAYFGAGDECHMAFHFPIMPRMFMSLHMEDRFPVLDILEQTPPIPEACQWALFLRNHDELTLEMVTDEERDYMYRVYAQNPQMRLNLGIRRRLAPLLGNHRRRIELMKGLLLSMPGTPILYYGDEIGMGDNIYLGDRNGVRTPMQWSADRNAGFSRANPQSLYLPIIIDPEYHYETINVEAQQSNPTSFLWWMKRMIALRKRLKAFGRGTIEFLHPENRKVMAFVRRYDSECILMVANLSRFAQYTELDLAPMAGSVPVELFGLTEFPPIGEKPYVITIGPHSFFLFSLTSAEQRRPAIEIGAAAAPPVTEVGEAPRADLNGKAVSEIEKVLPDYLKRQRWFGGRLRQIKSATMREEIPPLNEHGPFRLATVKVEYVGGDSESYLLPLGFISGARAEEVHRQDPSQCLVRLKVKGQAEWQVVYEATSDRDFCNALLDTIGRRRYRKGQNGALVAATTRAYRRIRGAGDRPLEPSVITADQHNTSILYEDRFVLKLFRRLEAGKNPDLEIGRVLTEEGFDHVPPLAGAIEHRRDRGEPTTLAVLHGFVPNEGDAWDVFLDELNGFYERSLAGRARVENAPLPPSPWTGEAGADLPPLASETIGPCLDAARLIGQRTGELHVFLGSLRDDPDFTPEPFSKLYQRAMYQSMRGLALRVLSRLGQQVKHTPHSAPPNAQRLLDKQNEIIGCFRSVVDLKIKAMRIRCHGDYRLGQLLYTGKDLFIIDFEGEPARSLSERRIKRSPLRDVAGMLRSFHYAAQTSLFAQEERGLAKRDDLPFLKRAADFWLAWVSVVFFESYLNAVSKSALLPRTRQEMERLLQLFLLDKAVYELGHELDNRPEQARIPILGILELLENC